MTCGTLDASHLAQMRKQDPGAQRGWVPGRRRRLQGDRRSASRATHIADESDLTLLGYIAFLDPPKESAGTAIAALTASGVAVKILTGDNEIITRKICREVGIEVRSTSLLGARHRTR